MHFNKITFKPFFIGKRLKKKQIFFLVSPSWHPFISKFHKKIEIYDYTFCSSLVFPLQNGFTYVYWASRFCIIAEKVSAFNF